MSSVSHEPARPAGDAIARFQSALAAFRARLDAFPALADRLLDGAGEWLDLLEYKLAPNLGEDPCLVVAIAGGTNTGKSTVYNLLLQRDTSPVRMTAAATCRPLLAASPRRAEAFRSGWLLSAFRPLPLTDPGAVLDVASPKDALYITPSDTLPDTFVLLDTPDIDSIDTANWEVADHIRAAGDVVIAVLTGEKYKDVRVVEYFRTARAAGRLVLPLMNKANPADNFAVARAQLQEFCQDTGAGTHAGYAVAHDFSIGDDFRGRPIQALDNAHDLFAALQALNVTEIKAAVYRDTLRHFVREASGFVRALSAAAHELHAAQGVLQQLAAAAARRYDPKPGAQVGVLMHEFVQSKRGTLGRALGTASKGFLNVTSAGARVLGRRVFGRDILAPAPRPTAKETDRINEEELKARCHEALQALYEECDRLPGNTGALVKPALDALDPDAAIAAVVRDTVKAESVSAAFRAHAFEVMETWWREEKTQRTMIEVADRVLMVAPAAIVLYTIPGTGIGEAAAAAGSSFLEQVAVRALLFQFGGRIVRLIGPWQQEQRAALETALLTHIVAPALARVSEALAVLEGEEAAELKRNLEACAA